MSDPETIDGEVVVEEHDPRPLPAVLPTVPTLSVTPTVQATELVARLDVIKQAMQTAMVENVDYGRIPGAQKPSLFKPGAEKLAVLFQFDVQTVTDKQWAGEHLTVIAKTTVFHAPSGARLGGGEGLCTTREKKYGKRTAKRTCPQCGAPAVIKGKAEFGGGWLCFRKQDGCGAKFPDSDPQIVGQEVGEIENPELPDTWNTVIKMARKRALVDAVLITTGASALFTQDVEDGQPDNDDVKPSTAAPPPPPEPTATPGDIAAMKAAAGGLTGLQIKLAMGALGLSIPNPPPSGPDGLFSWVPQSKAYPLAERLASIARPSAEASA